MPERLRFYVDEHVPNAVARGLLLHGADVLTTAEAGRIGASDDEQLAFAARAGRVLYTQDADFLRLHEARALHAGIAYARQGRTVGDVVRGLLRLYDAGDPERMSGTVTFL